MTAEEEARQMLARMDIPNALLFSAGDVVELANLIADKTAADRQVERVRDVLIEMYFKENQETCPSYWADRINRAIAFVASEASNG